MASTRNGRPALGSYEWIKEERHQANEETLRHVEDFSYSVSHELEWLNEKMAEVFNGDPKTLTDIFKTPGRLRNKTPRTARKANALTPRVPLGDVFSSHNAQPTPTTAHKLAHEQLPVFKIAEDDDLDSFKATSRSKSPQRAGLPGNTDSGYHGMTEDEMDAELSRAASLRSKLDSKEAAQSRETSFTSAHETHSNAEAKSTQALVEQPVIDTHGSLADDETPSDAEPEEKTTVNRKSSFNFSSLPARQPFLSKKSLGPSHSSLEQQGLGGSRPVSKVVEDAEQPKTTTQLLHERITMLGQPKATRVSKSIHYPDLPTSQAEGASQTQQSRPPTAASPTRPISMMSTSSAYENTTPGSTKKQYDGPLSASKNRLMSVLKSARSIFASSASTSAAAKLEAHTTPLRRSPTRELSHESSILDMPGALRSDASLARSLQRPLSVVSMSPSRSEQNTRAHEQEARERQQAEDELERIREQERAKVAKEQEDRLKAEIAEVARREKEAQKQAAPAAGKLKSVGRPVRPVNPPKVPVAVKTTSQAEPGVPRPGSAMRPSSAHSTLKASALGTATKTTRALEAAARKKEVEEKDKARRAQQKKELERKRAAKQAEDERKAAEAQRVAQEAKLAAQKQAAEDAKRREQQRAEQQRVEAQRQQEELQRQKAAQELADAIAKERAQQQAQIQREATGTIRQLGQKVIDAGIRVIQANPAKPAKRPAEDEISTRSATHQQNDGKRRKTDEVDENHRASVMGPPMRPSTIRKETVTRFPTGYTQAPAHPPNTLFKPSQHHTQHVQRPTHPNQTVQMSNARIAFAESSAKPVTAIPSGHPDAQGKFKTPVRAVQTNAKSAAKSSPMYPNGDNIALPEINTDSEEEDDDDDEDTGFRAPSWVTSPALRDLLTQQQLVDPETVFGPIAELRMEEVFKNGKNPERLKKFRDRGSSAAWVQNGDAVTSAEKRRDMELRERVAREGGWRYQPGL